MSSSRRTSAPPATPAARRILSAAEQCFGTLGFHKTSVTEIAVAAQVSKPLVYRYFESKEHLYEVVVGQVVEAWNEELLAELTAPEAAPGAPAVARALRGMHETSLAFARRSSLLQGLLAQESRLMLAAYSDVVERSTERWRQQVAACLQRGVELGEVRSDLTVETMTDALTELHLAYAERVVKGRENPDEARLAREGFECLLSGICVSPLSESP